VLGVEIGAGVRAAGAGLPFIVADGEARDREGIKSAAGSGLSRTDFAWINRYSSF
jgi:hypothetical protein